MIITLRLSVWQEGGTKYQVRKQKTLEDTFKLFTESSFDHLYLANYLSIEDKEQIRINAENQGLAPHMTAEERKASITAQQNSTQKDKMASYQ